MVGGGKQRQMKGPQLEPHQIILRPLVTEKGTHQSTRHNTYPFEVNLLATKEQIKAAVEELFNVRVAKVRTQTRVGKRKRFRNRPGRLSNWKKALVTLHEEDRLEFF
ncbi:MAG: 50S ribosomal protein L23 [Gemmatales bacterium]|nr:50S ribosomal protein L23 [Gemmatales bacterium]MDW8386815.1 50S ribosomal protein L23 [Gemmatales bacterium]